MEMGLPLFDPTLPDYKNLKLVQIESSYARTKDNLTLHPSSSTYSDPEKEFLGKMWEKRKTLVTSSLSFSRKVFKSSKI